MITMDMIGKVRRMKLRDKFSTSAIAKLTGLWRNTVKKWLKAPGSKAPKYSRESSEGKHTAFEETLEQALTADSHRPKHGRRTAKALFGQIQAQGYRGGYSAVTDFTRAWRELSGKAITRAFVPWRRCWSPAPHTPRPARPCRASRAQFAHPARSRFFGSAPNRF